MKYTIEQIPQGEDELILKYQIFNQKLKLNIKFASNNVTETKPDGKYETISYYRYVTVNRETIWSTESQVEGYTKTGNTKIK